MPYVILTDVSYAHFNGTKVISDLTASLRGKTGIVGQNGSGKTTLMRLITGELQPTSGTVSAEPDLLYLPQDLILNKSDTIADLMGIRDRIRALRAIQAGSTSAKDFDTVADDWDMEERALAMLHSLDLAKNLSQAENLLKRTIGTLSGGEAMAVALAGSFIRHPSTLLLDEPTNNLDSHARKWFYSMVRQWPGCLLVVSHDRELLECMDTIAELRNGNIRLYGGPFSFYLKQSRLEQEAAEQKVVRANAKLKQEKRLFAADQTKAAMSAQQGERARIKNRFPTAAIHMRRSYAEKNQAKQRTAREERIDKAHAVFKDAKATARLDEHITIELPETALPPDKIALELETAKRLFSLQGPERISLAGRNGSGKTTLLKAILGKASIPHIGIRRVIAEVGYLPQRLDYFDDDKSAIENLRHFAPQLTTNDAHAVLAQFLLKNNRAHQTAGTLSGGERLRLALACLLSANPAPRLVLLDEPTNNLDLKSIEELTEAMNKFRGAIIAVSHDAAFLQAIGVKRTWEMRNFHLTEGNLTSG